MGYPTKMNAAHYYVDVNAEKRPTSVAIYFRDQRITYKEIHDRVNRFGNALKDLGIKKGERFVCRMPNRPEAAIVFLAGVKIGAVPIPSFHFLKQHELEYIINISDAVGIVSDSQSIEDLRDIRAKCSGIRHIITVGQSELSDHTYEELIESHSNLLEPADTSKDDIAMLCFTSGTTGNPKGLPHRQESLVMSADVAVPHGLGGLEVGDIVFSTNPFGFSYGLCTMIFNPFRFGASVVYAEGKMEPERVFEILERYHVTHFLTVSAMFHKLLSVPNANQKYDLTHLRVLKGGAMETPIELQKRWEAEFGLPILPGYGLQEIIGSVLSCTPTKFKYGSIGLPQPCCDAKIVDENNQEVPTGQQGRLIVKVPCVIPYYWKDQQRTEEYLKGEWLYTDDIAFQDKDGFFFYIGRSDNVIISSGWTISPVEIEDVIKKHPSVSDAAAIAVSDPEKGRIPVAAIVLKGGLIGNNSISDELNAFVRSELAPYKCPRKIYFVDSVPRTSTGKVRIAELRNTLQYSG